MQNHNRLDIQPLLDRGRAFEALGVRERCRVHHSMCRAQEFPILCDVDHGSSLLTFCFQIFFALNLIFNGVVSFHLPIPDLLPMRCQDCQRLFHLDVDTFHRRPRSGPLNHTGVHYEHILQLCRYRDTGPRHLLRVAAASVVGWRGYARCRERHYRPKG